MHVRTVILCQFSSIKAAEQIAAQIRNRYRLRKLCCMVISSAANIMLYIMTALIELEIRNRIGTPAAPAILLLRICLSHPPTPRDITANGRLGSARLGPARPGSARLGLPLSQRPHTPAARTTHRLRRTNTAPPQVAPDVALLTLLPRPQNAPARPGPVLLTRITHGSHGLTHSLRIY